MTRHERSGLRARADRLDVERAIATAFDPVTGHLSSRALHEHLHAHAAAGDVPLAIIVASVQPHALPAAFGRYRGIDALDRGLAAAVDRRARTLGAVVATIDDGTVAVAVYGEDPSALPRVVGELQAQLAENPDLPDPQVAQATGTARDGAVVLAQALARRATADRAHLTPADRTSPPVTSGADEPRSPQSVGAGQPPGLCVVESGPRTADPSTAQGAQGAQGATMWDISDLLTAHPASGVSPLLDHADAPRRVAVRSRVLAERPALANSIRQVRESGTQICLTGYGSGRDPFDSLDELPIDTLALDDALVRGALVSRADRAVLWSITTQARRFKLPLLSHIPIARSPARDPAAPQSGWTRLRSTAQVQLEDAWVAGLTAAETALLLNAERERTADGRRWTRYEVALAWHAAF